MSEKKRIAATVYAVFEAGKNKELSLLEELHSNSGKFTKFDDFPPYTRQELQQAIIYEQAAFANISDFQYNIDQLRIDMLGEVAIATFYLDYKGVFVNDYSFEGRPVSNRSRVTMVLAKEAGRWKIVHEHFSTIPEWPSAESKDQKGGA